MRDEMTMTGECLAIQRAYVSLCNGDPVIANYIVRDLYVTEATKLKELSWAMDKHGSPTKDEVRYLLDSLSEAMMGRTGPRMVEALGLALRICDVEVLLGRDPTDGIRESLEAEAGRLHDRLMEVTGESK
jgi:hypothetical protein